MVLFDGFTTGLVVGFILGIASITVVLIISTIVESNRKIRKVDEFISKLSIEEAKSFLNYLKGED